jgi:hypothetical protein
VAPVSRSRVQAQAGGGDVSARDRMTTRELADAYLDTHGEPCMGVQLDSLLAYVEARTKRRVAAWLETLAKPHTQPAAYYEEAARRLRDGECR